MPPETPSAKLVGPKSARTIRVGSAGSCVAQFTALLLAGVAAAAPLAAAAPPKAEPKPEPRAELKTAPKPPPPPMLAGPPSYRVAVGDARVEYHLLLPRDVPVGHQRPVLVWLSASGEPAPSVAALAAELGPIAARAGVCLLLAPGLAPADATVETWHARLRAVLGDAVHRGPLAPDRTVLLSWRSASAAAVPNLPNLEGGGRVVGLALLSAVPSTLPSEWAERGPAVLLLVGTADARWPRARALQERLAKADAGAAKLPMRLAEAAGAGPDWSPELAAGLADWVADLAVGRPVSGAALPRVPTAVREWAVGYAERAAKALAAPPDAPPSGWAAAPLPKPVELWTLHRPADWREPTDSAGPGVLWSALAPTVESAADKAAPGAARFLVRLDEGPPEIKAHLATRAERLATVGVRYESLAVRELTLFGQGPATLTLEHVRAVRLRTAGVPEDGFAEQPMWVLTLWRPGPTHSAELGQWLQVRVEWPSSRSTAGKGETGRDAELAGDSPDAELAVRLLRQLRPTRREVRP